jgi:hypothetical protein
MNTTNKITREIRYGKRYTYCGEYEIQEHDQSALIIMDVFDAEGGTVYVLDCIDFIERSPKRLPFLVQVSEEDGSLKLVVEGSILTWMKARNQTLQTMMFAMDVLIADFEQYGSQVENSIFDLA